MCLGEEGNSLCPAACQFRLFNEDHGIDENSIHIEATRQVWLPALSWRMPLVIGPEPTLNLKKLDCKKLQRNSSMFDSMLLAIERIPIVQLWLLMAQSFLFISPSIRHRKPLPVTISPSGCRFQGTLAPFQSFCIFVLQHCVPVIRWRATPIGIPSVERMTRTLYTLFSSLSPHHLQLQGYQLQSLSYFYISFFSMILMTHFYNS